MCNHLQNSGKSVNNTKNTMPCKPENPKTAVQSYPKLMTELLNLGRMQGGDLEYLGPLHAGYGWHKEQCILAALEFGNTCLGELP